MFPPPLLCQPLPLNGNIIAWNAPFLLSILVVKVLFFMTWCQGSFTLLSLWTLWTWQWTPFIDFSSNIKEESNPILGTNLITRPFLQSAWQQLAWSLTWCTICRFLWWCSKKVGFTTIFPPLSWAWDQFYGPYFTCTWCLKVWREKPHLEVITFDIEWWLCKNQTCPTFIHYWLLHLVCTHLWH